jgi:uncharacterized membrane protein
VNAPRTSAVREFDYDRTVALSDALFAIALTLLVLNLTVPALIRPGAASFWHALAANSGELLSYVVSFAVIGLFWTRHHAFFRGIRRVDGRLLGLNLLYLGIVAFLPFPTRILGVYGDRPEAVAVYAVTISLVSLVAIAMRLHARRAGLLETGAAPDPIWHLVSVPVVFLLSIPLAFLSTTAAELSWLSIAALERLSPRRAA